MDGPSHRPPHPGDTQDVSPGGMAVATTRYLPTTPAHDTGRTSPPERERRIRVDGDLSTLEHHLGNLKAKAILTTATLATTLPWRRGSRRDLALASLALSGLLYASGDLILLPRFGNRAATVADAGLAAMVLWIAGRLSRHLRLGAWDLLRAATGIAVQEYAFHRYLQGEAQPGAGDRGETAETVQAREPVSASGEATGR